VLGTGGLVGLVAVVRSADRCVQDKMVKSRPNTIKRHSLMKRRKVLMGKDRQRQADKARAKRKEELVKAEKKKAYASGLALRMYRPELRTLLVGEGNFSFTRALIRKWEATRVEEEGGAPVDSVEDLVGFRVVATCLDSKVELLEKYPDVADIVREIKGHGATVHTGIDATKLLSSKRIVKSLTELCEDPNDGYSDDDDERRAEREDIGFDRIIFNFPHIGCGISDTKENNRVHREMITAFFKSAHSVLADQGQVHVTVKVGEPYESWRVPALAIETGLLKVHSAVPFDPTIHDGYVHRRTVGAPARPLPANVDVDSDKTASRTLIFVKADAPSRKQQKQKEKELLNHNSDSE